MKNTEIREFEDTDLLQKLKDARAELFNLRFQLATGQQPFNCHNKVPIVLGALLLCIAMLFFKI